MSWFNRQIAKLAPGYALKRQIAQMRLERLEESLKNWKNREGDRRSFEAVSGNRLRADFLSNRLSADSSLEGADTVRYQVRQLEQNSGFIAGPIARVVNNVVGNGFKFQSRVRADENNYIFPEITEDDAKRFNFEMEKNFSLWARQADKRLILNFDYCLRMIEGALLRDGAILAIGRISDRKTRHVPYCLELCEIDRLQTPMEETTNPQIRGGIEYDKEGVPSKYYILKTHPGDTVIGLKRKLQDIEEVPAFNDNGTRKVLHLYNVIRPEQTLGYSQFASALKDYQDLDRYREAEIMAALEAACLTGFVKAEDPTLWQAGRTVENMEEADSGGTTRRIHEFSPGEWHYLNPGEDVTVYNPARPTEIFGQFTQRLLEGPANALDIPPEMLTQDWKGMNYSNARTVLLQFYLTCFIRRKYLLDYFCAPVYENVARQIIAMGHIKAAGFAKRPDDYLNHSWITPGWGWVDPVTEARGKEIELNNNIECLSDILSSKGKDFEEHLEQRARELRKIKELEEKYGIKFPEGQSKAQGTEVAAQSEEEDAGQDDGKKKKKTAVLKAVSLNMKGGAL